MLPGIALLFWNRNGDVAISDDAVVISLQIDRSWLSLVAVESASGRARELDIVVIQFAVAQDGDMSADEGDVEGRPFAQSIFRALWRWVPTVDCSHLVRRELATFGAHLDRKS